MSISFCSGMFIASSASPRYVASFVNFRIKNMKTKIVYAMFISCMGMTSAIFAQQAEKNPDELKAQLQRRLMESRVQRTMQQAVTVQPSKYNHRELEILAKLNTEEIPADFPVYKDEYTNDQYTILMNKWYDAHPALLRNSNEEK
jgi:hypothetical protein